MTQHVILASYAYLPHTGGVENSLYHLAIEYQRYGYEVTIISTDAGYDSVHDDKGLNVVRIPRGHHLLGKIRYLFNHYFAWRRLYKQFAKSHVPTPLVIARHHHSVCFARLARFSRVVYLVPSVHRFEYSPQTMLDKYMQRAQQCFQAFACRLASQVGVFSHNMAKQLHTIGINDTLRFNPGVSQERFHPLSELKRTTLRLTHHIEPEDVVLLCVGRMVVNKGFDLVIEAFATLIQDNPLAMIKLILVGEGEAHSDLLHLSERLGVNNQIIWVGSTTKPELYYQMSDAFLFSSRYEPFGQTLIEAAACQLPIVAFTPSDEVHTATDKIFNPEDIYWVESLSADSLAYQCQRLIEDHLLRQTPLTEQYSNVLQRYSWHSLSRALWDQVI